jgi:hypothetical protein
MTQTDRNYASTLRIVYEDHPGWLPSKSDEQLVADARQICADQRELAQRPGRDAELEERQRAMGYPGRELYTGGNSVAGVVAGQALRTYCPELS